MKGEQVCTRLVNKTLILKITGALLIMLSGIGIAVYMSVCDRIRINELTKMLRLFNVMASNIRFDEATLTDIALRFSNEEGCYGSFFRKLSNKMMNVQKEPFEMIWTGCVNDCLRESGLTKEDRNELSGFGINLVNTDKQLQLALINDFTTDLKKKIDALKNSLGEKTKLYVSFGIMGSLFLIILLY